MQLHPVRFNWKNKTEDGDKLGLIAQDLQKVLPEVVRDYDYKRDETTGKEEKIPAAHLGVMYADIIPVIINVCSRSKKLLMIKTIKLMNKIKRLKRSHNW